MIIGNKICKSIDGMTLNVDGRIVNVMNNHGQQDALDKFIAESTKLKADKFPLVFYVTNKVKDLRTRKQCKTSIVIMTNTNPDWLSKARTVNSFEKVIEPIYNKLIPIIERNFQIVDNEIEFQDKDNYGIIDGNISKTLRKASNKSTVPEYIDARIINLTLQYDEC